MTGKIRQNEIGQIKLTKISGKMLVEDVVVESRPWPAGAILTKNRGPKLWIKRLKTREIEVFDGKTLTFTPGQGFLL